MAVRGGHVPDFTRPCVYQGLSTTVSAMGTMPVYQFATKFFSQDEADQPNALFQDG
jgi:hypothetical protein